MTEQSYGNWQKYQSKNPLQRSLINRFLREVTGLIAPLPGTSILDAGCGEGFVLNMLLASRADLKVAIGIDIDGDALQRGGQLFPNMPLLQADILRLPFASNSFDIVVCTEVLEHFHHPEAVLSELCRVSKQYCLFSVPHEPFFRLSNLLRGKSISRLGSDVDHHQNWSQAAFVKFLQGPIELLHVRRSFPWQIALGQVR